jgi:hypothetical protein
VRERERLETVRRNLCGKRKEKEKNVYGIHQYTLTRRREVRVEKKGTSNKRQTSKKENRGNSAALMHANNTLPLSI